jgi:glycosyltransferase involved in cell wall biosynthesis
LAARTGKSTTGDGELSLRTKIKRLKSLYKLLWADERLSELESVHAGYRLATLEMLKSRLEVSPELLAEFEQWKFQATIPATPLVSVCIATHNRARLLTERSIPSVLGQSYPNFELIVIGDGCTDRTAELIQQINDPRLEFLNRPEQETYPADAGRRRLIAGTAALNHALMLARGDYITHLDDDDEYLPERLDKLVCFAKANECDVVWHPFWIENQAGHRTLNEALSFDYGQVTTSSVFYRSWFKRIKFSSDAHHLLEPGDWNWARRIKYFNPVCMRYPEPLHVKHQG